MITGTYTSISGVEHGLDYRGRCVTCGRNHRGDMHGRTVDAYLPGEPCDITAKIGGYPYPCERQDRKPDATIAICTTHRVWWVET